MKFNKRPNSVSRLHSLFGANRLNQPDLQLQMWQVNLLIFS